MEAFVKAHIENKIGYITFFHPAGNSFPSSQLKQLVAAIEHFDTSSEVNVIVLQSEGKTFCAGASFDELLEINNFETGKKFFSGFAKVINAMRQCNKLIITKVQGKAVGGGVGIICASDYVLAAQVAEVKLSEIAIGIGPFVIEPAVSRKIGKTAMSILSLEPTQFKTAQWAFEKGMYSRLFDTIEMLETETQQLAQELASYNPEALKAIKKVFWQNTENWNELLTERAAISGNLVLSDFTKNALNAFRKK